MNVEFHYYCVGFLAVKAGFPLEQASILAFSSQYVDHHDRPYEIQGPRGLVQSCPTQNYSFWDPMTVSEVLAPFHFLPAGSTLPSPRQDGATHPWDVRPNAEPAKTLLVTALKSRDLYQIGIALHTFADAWAHQNFTARNEPWNRLDPTNLLPSPGHAHAGRAPDSWTETWADPRLKEPTVVNSIRFLEAARKIYRYLCVFRGKAFQSDEHSVLAALASRMDAGASKLTTEERMLDFVVADGLEPYHPDLWRDQALVLEDEAQRPAWRKAGEAILHKFGLGEPVRARTKPRFEASHWAAWARAAEVHRQLAKSLIESVVKSQS